MLIKLLHIVSALVLAAGAYFAIQNRAAFKEARLEKNRIAREEIEPTERKFEERIREIEKEVAIWEDADRSKDDRQIENTNAQANLKAKTQDLVTLNQEIEQKTAEINQLETELRVALGNSSIDQLQQTIESLTQEIAGLRNEAEQQAKELELAASEVQKHQLTVGALEKNATMRSKGITMNAFESVITAVNPDYGFAVVGAGSRQGVTGESKLIVKRGTQRIGVLTINSIEPNNTVADIVQNSVPRGYSIQPGDRVIVEKVQK